MRLDQRAAAQAGGPGHLLVEPTEGRAGVARHQRRGVQPSAAVDAQLLDRDASSLDQRPNQKVEPDVLIGLVCRRSNEAR